MQMEPYSSQAYLASVAFVRLSRVLRLITVLCSFSFLGNNPLGADHSLLTHPIIDREPIAVNSLSIFFFSTGD